MSICSAAAALSATVLALSLVAAAPPAKVAPATGLPLDYYLPAGTAYDPRVPTPEQFLGWQIGEWHLRSELSTAYLRAVAAAAPERVKFEIVGHTHEQKPLVLLTITAPANHARLEEIRTEHLALFDPAKSGSLDLSRMPVVVDLGYSVHGNEPSGANAMPLVVYHLAAARGAEVEAMLRQTVILIEAQRNPDGGDRAAHWFNTNKSANLSADPSSREHLEAWPRGRFNHYLFDPNRDWLPLVHPEAQARAELFFRWRPNVLTDHHEMGSDTTFFFQPGVPTRNNPHSPAKVIELTHKIAAFHQRALDGRGALYYSEQGFDDFYPGKGSTYPDLHGTVGILFEQASSRGHAQESVNGLLTFPFTIRNQVITSFSSVNAAVALRGELLALQRDFTPQTLELARQSRVQAFVFGDDGDPARAWAFRDLLARHRVEVRPLEEKISVGGRTYQPGAAWVVLANQAQYRLVMEMFVPRTKFEDAVFYDVSAWTLPPAFNLPWAELEQVARHGAPLAGAPEFPAGRLVGGHSDYAYVFNWNGYFAPRALHRLQKAGLLVKGLTSAPVEVIAGDGTRATLGYGAVLVPVGLQPDRANEIRALIDTIVREDAVTVYGCRTGLTPAGVDFGSASFVVLPKPAVALITGEGVDQSDIGAAWHVLDQRVGVAVTLLEQWRMATVDFGRYTTIVMADGRYNEISDDTVAALKRWVRGGGTLVVMGRAAEWAARKELAAIEFAGRAPEGAPAAGRSRPAATEDAADKPAERRPYASGENTEALRLISGAIAAGSIDPTHPIGYGFSGDTVALSRANGLMMKPAKSPYETPVVYPGQPLISGYVSAENLRRLAHSAAVVGLPVGKGAVVAMVDDPNFRGFWYGGNRMFFNAIFYGHAIRPIRTSGEGDDEEAHSH